MKDLSKLFAAASQLWKAAGLTPKLLGKAGRGVLRDLVPNARGGCSKHLVRAALSGGGPSSGSLSALCCELNPKTLKVCPSLPSLACQEVSLLSPVWHHLKYGYADVMNRGLAPAGDVLAST